jgi:hypothetical protein
MRYQLVFDMPQEKAPLAEAIFNAIAFIKKATLAPFAEKPYDPVFVAKVRRGEEEIAKGNGIHINPDKLWN